LENGLTPGRGETLDEIGPVRVLQRRDGYRLTVDPLLLARFTRSAAGPLKGRVIDLGTGCGILPLLLAHAGVSSVGLELQPPLFDLAARNVRLNGLEARISVVRGDLREVERLFAKARFRHVVCNPPYHRARHGLTNPDLERALARHELACTVRDVVRAARWLLEPLGSLWIIFPAARLAELLEAVRRVRLSPRRLQLIHPRADTPARRVLLQAVKAGRATLEVLPPCVLESRLQPAVQAL